jgi:type VI secretion system protein ImpE
MATPTPAEQALRDGDAQHALKLLQDQIRSAPADAKLRVFLFQLLSVLGQWERALNQLTVAGELDASTLAMVQTYREAIQCERLRADVFRGKRVPLLFGEPQAWVALLIEAMLREGQGAFGDAQKLRDQAFEQAPSSSGQIDGKAFAWLADADMRLGPVLEAVVNGRYYWIPMAHLAKVTFDAPVDLRDCVWTAAQLEFTNGGESVALIPTRYCGTDLSQAPLALARLTEWTEPQPGLFAGVGQRVLTSDVGDFGLLDVRSIVFDPVDAVADAPDT